MSETWSTILAWVIGVVLFAALGLGMWKVARWWNYTWGYETQVQETVCEMVKPEYLKDPSDCD